MLQTVDKPTHRKNASLMTYLHFSSYDNALFFHRAVKRLCESIFAYCVKNPGAYLCTPVGSVSSSACVSRRLQTVDKPTHRKNTSLMTYLHFSSYDNALFFHRAVKRLCESIFAYCVKNPGAYLCTPVGAFSLSACVSRCLQFVKKFDKLRHIAKEQYAELLSE